MYKRVREHRNKVFVNSFTSRYNIEKLVYFEVFTVSGDAFEREKRMKGSSRKRKIELVNSLNLQWVDLFEKLKEHQGEELIQLKKFFKY